MDFRFLFPTLKDTDMIFKSKPGKQWKNSPCSLKIHLQCSCVFCHQGEVWCGPNCRRCWLPWRTPSALRGPGRLQSQHLTGESTNNSWRQLRRAGPRLHRYQNWPNSHNPFISFIYYDKLVHCDRSTPPNTVTTFSCFWNQHFHRSGWKWVSAIVIGYLHCIDVRS